MKLVWTAAFCAAGIFQMHLQACQGTVYACGRAEVLSIGQEFYENCSAGSGIEVVDACHPAEPSHHFWLYEFNPQR